ncbi:hypothetical protein QYE76_046471 [Lolium multiflorum]|uniref:Uncharacterized protein n=1 Tax=Lolium multiflorum TaxID=4521 RepID=A0AAD8X138_LOLMU|nr:hypothetical protein QYE76_046471 [Lolium multiflorum]
MTHLFSVIILLLKIYANKSCSGKHNPSTRIPRVLFPWLIPPPTAHTDLARAGVSRKTQELYLAVFVARYLDLFTDYISLYNTVMKARLHHHLRGHRLVHAPTPAAHGMDENEIPFTDLLLLLLSEAATSLGDDDGRQLLLSMVRSTLGREGTGLLAVVAVQHAISLHHPLLPLELELKVFLITAS